MSSRPQKIIVLILFLFLAFGIICLYSSCHQKGIFAKQDIFVKQLLWMGVGLGVMALVALQDYRKLRWSSIPLYVLSVATLAQVLFSGRAIMGAQRWISLGEFSFQPSEIGKFALILVLAQYFSSKGPQDLQADLGSAGVSRGLLAPLSLTLLPVALVLLQPDLGTAVVYLFIFLSIAFLAGIRVRYLAGLILAAGAFMPVFWHFLKDYQKSRLMVFLNPNSDPLGAGYTIIQSKIAIGSGRLFGKGWMSGTQSQLNFLAERHTDFIFSVWGEEWGFLGSLVLVVLYALLVIMILRVSDMSRDLYGRLLAAGVAALIFFHAFINLAMNIGMCPVVGLPLPFMSYGGSSLVINMAAIGIVLSIARQK
ncbi:MAG: rod shape-determining protein RodA [Candidatus Omnitrophota bacterium]